jgi:hypothetical protein
VRSNHRTQNFRLAPMGRPAGRWCTPATRGTVGKPKHSEAVHIYMGMACRAVTTFRDKTGTHEQINRYNDLKTQQQYREGKSKEYNDRLQHHLIPEGNRLVIGQRLAVAARQSSCSQHQGLHCCQCSRRALPGIAPKMS